MWVWLTVCAIIILMSFFYQRIWIFFGGCALTLFCLGASLDNRWLIIPAIICVLLAMPFLLIDYKESKKESLMREIQYTDRSEGKYGSGDLEKKLQKLEQQGTWEWVISWFRKKK